MFLIIVMYFIAFCQSEKENRFVFRVFISSYTIFFTWAFLYWAFMNFEFYSRKGNGAGSEWVNEKTSITAFNEINRIKKTEAGAFVVCAHYKDKMIEGLVSNYSNGYSTDDYNAIITNNFKNNSSVVLIITMPINLNTEEQQFLKDHKNKVLRSFEKEQIIRIDL